MGKHKQISCEICSKVMRSDHLSRYIKEPIDLSWEDPEQFCKSILEDVVDNILNKKPSKDETSTYREKPKVNGMDEPTLSSDEI